MIENLLFFFSKSIKYLYIVTANCPVSQLEISPLIALLNMIKDNYFDRPQVFQTLIAVLHDYNHNFNSASKVSNLMAFILLKSLWHDLIWSAIQKFEMDFSKKGKKLTKKWVPLFFDGIILRDLWNIQKDMGNWVTWQIK